MPVPKLDPRDRRIASYRAGQAVACVCLGIPYDEVSIDQGFDPPAFFDGEKFVRQAQRLRRQEAIRNVVLCLVAGSMAEWIMGGADLATTLVDGAAAKVAAAKFFAQHGGTEKAFNAVVVEAMVFTRQAAIQIQIVAQRLIDERRVKRAIVAGILAASPVGSAQAERLASLIPSAG